LRYLRAGGGVAGVSGCGRMRIVIPLNVELDEDELCAFVTVGERRILPQRWLEEFDRGDETSDGVSEAYFEDSDGGVSGLPLLVKACRVGRVFLLACVRADSKTVGLSMFEVGRRDCSVDCRAVSGFDGDESISEVSGVLRKREINSFTEILGGVILRFQTLCFGALLSRRNMRLSIPSFS
jgi:hypothetical protein